MEYSALDPAQVAQAPAQAPRIDSRIRPKAGPDGHSYDFCYGCQRWVQPSWLQRHRCTTRHPEYVGKSWYHSSAQAESESPAVVALLREYDTSPSASEEADGDLD